METQRRKGTCEMDNDAIIHVVEQPTDLKQLVAMTRDILGQCCWQAKLGYGDELFLEFGSKVQMTTKKRDMGTIGEWSLESCGTDWRLVSSSGTLLVDSEDIPTKIKEKIQQLVDSRVTALEVHYPTLGLTVSFDNGHKLTITPKPEDDEFELPYWDLFTPQGIIKVGSGSRWSFEE